MFALNRGLQCQAYLRLLLNAPCMKIGNVLKSHDNRLSSVVGQLELFSALHHTAKHHILMNGQPEDLKIKLRTKASLFLRLICILRKFNYWNSILSIHASFYSNSSMHCLSSTRISFGTQLSWCLQSNCTLF